jgi:hypothetical protein
MRYLLIGGLSLLAAYGIGALYLYFFQERFLFHPTKAPSEEYEKILSRPDVQPLSFTRGNIILSGWMQIRPESHKWLLYF